MTSIISEPKKGSLPSPPTVKYPYPVIVITLGILGWGWLQRGEYWIRAEEGLGYAFGIAGAVMMLLLLFYPLSKRVKYLRAVIASRHWFKGHMLLGILGPLFILFHSNFGLGSTNSNVALFSMLLVVASGLIGRYIYLHTHNGLYGKKLNYNELRDQHLQYKNQLQQSSTIDENLGSMLLELETISNNPDKSLVHSFNNVRAVRKKSKLLYRHLGKMIKQQTKNKDDEQQHPMAELQKNLRAEIQLLQSMVGLSFYNKLFSIWHVVHLPFFYMLIITAVVHVVVVHMY